jgi:hypothetical protein
MTHYYEKNIVDIKNEYTDFLTGILTPLLFEGLKSIYEKAIKIEDDFRQRELLDPNFKNPGIFKLFQICLRDIPNLNTASIESETSRIKERSKCSEWFDLLLKSTIKSHIILLTFTTKKKKSKIVEERFHEKIDTNLFIHKCYIECSRIFFNYPELFWHHFTTLDIKRNQREIYDLIKVAIKEAIRKTLPIKLILDEYLKNDYDYYDDIKSEDKYTKIKKLIDKENNSYKESLSSSCTSTQVSSESESENLETSNNQSNNQSLGVNKIFDSDEQEIIESEMKKLENEIKNSEKIEEEADLLLSQISQSVNINNLVLNTSVQEEDENLNNIVEVENDIKNDIKNDRSEHYVISFKEGSGKKKNDNLFFKEELSKYKLSKPPENKINTPKQQNINDNSNKDINLTVKKTINQEKSDKSEFFNAMLNK